MIRDVLDQDAAQIASIYNYYVNRSTHTFETIPIDEEEMLSRIRSIRAHYPFIVFEKDKVGGVCTNRGCIPTKALAASADVADTINEEILIGQDLYSIHCVECHGPDGEGGEIQGVEGLDGTILKSISSRDEMYTRSDDTLFAIIDYGQQELGMPPYGLAYGGPLKRGEIEAVVTFMRYTWDDRVELPQEAASAGAVPDLIPDQVPSYESHIAPITKRYCISCHRPGKENNNYLMETYQEILTTGDHAGKNVIPGDLESYLILTINGVKVVDPDTGEDIQQMPPTKLMKDEYIQIFESWVLNGMPETDADAESLLESTSGE